MERNRSIMKEVSGSLCIERMRELMDEIILWVPWGPINSIHPWSLSFVVALERTKKGVEMFCEEIGVSCHIEVMLK